eukprot:COSAG03_NODE_890_length_5476_cov_35.296468_3_plen_121_part_00
MCGPREFSHPTATLCSEHSVNESQRLLATSRELIPAPAVLLLLHRVKLTRPSGQPVSAPLETLKPLPRPPSTEQSSKLIVTFVRESNPPYPVLRVKPAPTFRAAEQLTNCRSSSKSHLIK